MTLTLARLRELERRYRDLTLLLVGDICLDRYFDIDPSLAEVSIETGLPVHLITRTRCLPGAGGTILNNLVALGVGRVELVSFCGEDGEGWELKRALARLRGVGMDGFLTTPTRSTFCYTKPLVHTPGQPPRELERLDLKNITPTPAPLAQELAARVAAAGRHCDGVVVMEQVDRADTGAITPPVLAALADLALARPAIPIVADSRRSLERFAHMTLKMNVHELARMVGTPADAALPHVRAQAVQLARSRGRPVVVTLAERGLIAAAPDGASVHVPALPVRGPIDVVGAGDSVTANLTAAIAAGATLEEAGTLAMGAASVVIHQLGTTGTATMGQIAEVLGLASQQARS